MSVSSPKTRASPLDTGEILVSQKGGNVLLSGTVPIPGARKVFLMVEFD